MSETQGSTREHDSTQSCIQFRLADDPEIRAAIHLEWDGMPTGQQGVLASLDRFFTEIEGQTADDDQAFADPNQLAARYVAWAILRRAQDPSKPLSAPGVSITSQRPDEIGFIYDVLSGPQGRPEVKYVTAGSSRA